MLVLNWNDHGSKEKMGVVGCFLIEEGCSDRYSLLTGNTFGPDHSSLAPVILKPQ